MTKWTKAVPDNELDTAFFNTYFISLTEKECHVLKFKILQFCHVLSIFCGMGSKKLRRKFGTYGADFICICK